MLKPQGSLIIRCNNHKQTVFILMAEAKAKESPQPVKPVQMTAWSFD